MPLPERYPFTLPWLDPDFELLFEQPVTIIVGENGSGKSTVLEAIAALSGFGASGGGAWKGNDLSEDAEDAEALAAHLRAGWLPKVGRGWFLKAQGFAAVGSLTAKNYLGFSHGEGFVEMILDRMSEQGVFLFDEPEAALSPRKQAELLRFLSEIQSEATSQVILATHSPILMAVPEADIIQISHRGLQRIHFRDTDHFRLWSAFTADPDDFVAAAIEGRIGDLA
ncbi:AAA family ATPase [Loktanella sp. IMCC34160]|uniref:AAA family ATPase n=1 Tax=Loktanella sp. IMCC34160 TaxID=2510646 RepID=UPI001F5CB67D|nr:AAA family ATPase [Loktanella sp. IMCC34160]